MHPSLDTLGIPWIEIAEALAWRGDPILSIAASAFLLVVGATAASLSGLVADRLPGILGWEDDGRGLCSPPSSCEGCGGRIRPLALVPALGWFLCRGRCAGCGHKIPMKYPLVELAAGISSAALPAAIGNAEVALVLLPLAWACLALAWCDLRHEVLPEMITVPLLFAGLLFSPIEPDPWLRSMGAAAAAFSVWLSFAAVSRAKRIDAMSGGDVALAAAGGAWLGAYGFPSFIALACLLFVLHAAPLRRRGIRWVPFGPALCLSLVACAVAAA